MAELPKLTLTRDQWNDVYTGIEAGLKVIDLPHEFKYGLVRNRHKLLPTNKEIGDHLRSLDEDRKKLFVQFCKKDADGKPIIEKTPQGDRYVGLIYGMSPDYDTQSKALNDDMLAYLAEPVELSYYQIKAEHINDKVPGNVLSLIYPITEDKGA
jgi:hypothetical protein